MRVATLAVMAATLLGVSAASVSTVAAKRPLCRAGRFLVQGERLITAVGSGPQFVVLADGKAAIDEVCSPTHARLTRAKQGTAIAARWATCTGVEGRVRIKGTLDSACASLRGTLRARKADLRQDFSAERSACGDQVFDPSGGEACDAGLGCAATEHCTASCVCEPGAATTSTTVSTVPTTTTTCVASVVPDGATAPDYIMFTGMETGNESELGSTNCQPVTSPVRSGNRACKIGMGLFAALRPEGLSETSLFVRVYHRIDVTTPPSTIAFAPVIITDVLPQGITAADVGVDSDGTIRYRLRNRKDGVNLGESQPLSPGVWRRIELGTRIGDVTGSAELRIDGLPVVTVTNQNFGTTPLDSAFISNNPDQYGGAHGGTWTATFDDVAVTRNQYPGEGRVIARQGRVGTPSANDWTLVGASSIADAWSDTPPSGDRRAETPALGDPLAQTMLVAPFGQGVDPICTGNVVKACQVWLDAALTGTDAARSYKTRRRTAGVTTDVSLPEVCTIGNPPSCLGTTADLFSDALQSDFWSASLDDLNAAEIGAVKSGGAGGSGLKVIDAWVSCEYQ